MYRSISNATGGDVLLFGRGENLTERSTYVKNAFVGSVSVPVEPTGADRKRRSTVKTYSIVADDTMETLSVTVAMEGDTSEISLVDPKGHLQKSGKINTGKGSLYMVTKPRPGIWRLTVPSSTGKEIISAKGTSDENIDFDYFFTTQLQIGRRKHVTISDKPVKGKIRILPM